MDKEIDHVQSEKLSDFSALDLVKIQKWRDRVDRMAAELNDRYDQSVKENEKVAQHAYMDEEVMNKIVSIEDPDVPWIGEMPEDPPEDEQQFFTNDPGTKTLENIKEIVEEKLAQSVLKGKLKKELEDVVRARIDTFLTKGCPIERLVNHEHVIKTTGAPFKEKHFRVSPEQQEVLDKEIELMLAMGVIEPCESEWASRLLICMVKIGRAHV